MRHADVVALAEMRAACKNGSARRTRIAAEVTQREVGEACHVSPKTVALWETGQRTPGGHPALAYGRLLRDLAAVAEAAA
jgi:DNA-binding XRE family transcriptional regulator